jgi:Domain of unknown function (DUF4365)
MAQSRRRRSPRRRKSRTRQHVIADLSLHHLSGPVLRAGFTIEAHYADYGIDAHIETFDADGAVENGLIFVQLKATDNIETYRLENGDLSFPMEKRDLDYWAKEPYPAYLVLYDAQGDVAYWLYIQNYLGTQEIDVTMVTSASLSLHIPKAQSIEAGTPAQWRQHKADVISRMGDNLHA